MKNYRVTANALNVRKEPKLTGEILGFLQKDEIVASQGLSGDGYWHKIQRADGLIGWASHKFLVSLENEDAIQSEEFPWMPIAIREIGVHEYAGAAENPRILAYLRSTNLGEPYRSNDETHWCSAFVNWCIENAGYAGTDSAWALSWLHHGRALAAPRRGCISVFKRTGGGHVAFYIGESNSHVNVLGGNQGDAVCIKEYSKNDLLGYRIL